MSLIDRAVNWFSKPKISKTGETVPRSGEKADNIEAVNTRVDQFSTSKSSKDGYNFNPDELVIKKGINIYKLMLMDDQIKANSMLKKTSRLSTDNSVEDAGSESNDKLIGDFVRYSLYNHMSITMRSLLLSLSSGMDFGFALAEKNWEYLDDGNWAGYVVYKNINPKSPNGFYFDRDNDGTIKPRGIVQNVTSSNYYYLTDKEKAALPRFRTDKFVHYAHMSEFNNPYGQSDLKSAFRGWLSKDAVIKYWMMYLERHGAPLPHGKIPLGASEEEVKAFKNTIKNINGSSSIVTPEGFEIGYLESDRTAAPGFEEAIAIHNGSIDRSQMVPQLMGLSGGRGTGGSYGLGKTQYDVFIFYQETFGLFLEDVFNRQIIKPLVDLNFSGVIEYPKFQFASIRRETRKDRAAILQMLAGSGILKNVDPWLFNFVDLPIPRSAMPEPGTPIVDPVTEAIDDNRDNRPQDPEDRSVADGTNPYVDKTETDVT